MLYRSFASELPVQLQPDTCLKCRFLYFPFPISAPSELKGGFLCVQEKLKSYLLDVAQYVEKSSMKEGIPVSGFSFTFCCQQPCLLFSIELDAEEKCLPHVLDGSF